MTIFKFVVFHDPWFHIYEISEYTWANETWKSSLTAWQCAAPNLDKTPYIQHYTKYTQKLTCEQLRKSIVEKYADYKAVEIHGVTVHYPNNFDADYILNLADNNLFGLLYHNAFIEEYSEHCSRKSIIFIETFDWPNKNVLIGRRLDKNLKPISWNYLYFRKTKTGYGIKRIGSRYKYRLKNGIIHR